MSDVKIDTSAIDEVLELMKQLPDAVNKKVLASAERTALRPVNKHMQQLLAQRTNKLTGRLSGAIGIKLLKSNSPYNVSTLAGVRYGGRLGAPHAHLIEYGTSERQLKAPRVVTFKTKDGRSITANVTKTGKVEGRHFIADAISANEGKVQNEMNLQVLKSLDRYMRRLNKKFGR